MTGLDLIIGASLNDHMVAASATVSAVAIIFFGRSILIIAVKALQPQRPADGNGQRETRS
ncbi:MAG: hypothetical protein V4696_12715 [Pseudomonadota bacterium]